MTEHTNPNTDTNMNRSEHQANVDMQRTAPAKWQAPSTCSRYTARTDYSTAVVVGLALGAIFCGLYIIVTSL